MMSAKTAVQLQLSHTSAAMKHTSWILSDLGKGQSCLTRMQAIDLRRTVVILVLGDSDILHQVIRCGVSEITAVELETDNCVTQRSVLTKSALVPCCVHIKQTTLWTGEGKSVTRPVPRVRGKLTSTARSQSFEPTCVPLPLSMWPPGPTYVCL